jgi:hypothetical protein
MICSIEPDVEALIMLLFKKVATAGNVIEEEIGLNETGATETGVLTS